MTAVDTTRRASTLPWMLRQSAVATWRELPRTLAVGAIWLASLLPLGVAVVTGVWWLIALGSLPVALATTGVARFAATIARGDRPRVSEILSVDPVLALSMSAISTIAGALITSDIAIVGFAIAAVALVLTPYALAYGAVRGRVGLTAWRGAAILVAFRPSWAITIVSVMLLGGFAVAATAGTLGLVVPVAFGTFASGAIARLLDTIDEQGATR